ncbi:MAG: NAD(P)/FAD-dependent oxidoreductase [Bacilli bacterium]|nr:NAD(P)/FAD-dependent oxidoreductase [Bacilli bacterium]
MKKAKNVIVIGAGLSGMSTGIYLLKHGYRVTILERNSSVGGLCTGWYRQGRYVDGCIHWLSGSKDGHLCNDIWKDIGGITSEEDIVYPESWGDFDYNGTMVRFLRDYKKAEQEWLAISPEDSKMIKHFFKLVRYFIEVELPMDKPMDMLSLPRLMKTGFDIISHPGYLSSMNIHTDEYANKFKNPAIRWALEHAQPGPGNLFSMVFSYATIAANSGGVPLGGSKAFVERIKNRYLSLGGELKLNADVKRIDTYKYIARGVELKNGDYYPADYVVSSVDPYFTIHNLLEDKYKAKKLTKRYQDTKRYPTISCFIMTYEIEGLGEKEINTSFLTEPFDMVGRKVKYMNLHSFNYDPKRYVKDNKTVCQTLIHLFDEDYRHWEEIYQDKKLYRETKNRIAQELVMRLEKQYPQFKGKINVLDVFTPMTLKRYVNAFNGCYMTQFTTASMRLSHKGFIPGLDNVLLCNASLQTPGGLPYAAANGKYAAMRICKLDHVKFYHASKKLLKTAKYY